MDKKKILNKIDPHTHQKHLWKASSLVGIYQGLRPLEESGIT